MNPNSFAASVFVAILVLCGIGILAFVIVNRYSLPIQGQENKIAYKENQSVVMSEEEETAASIADTLNIAEDGTIVEAAKGDAKKASVKRVKSEIDQQKYYVAADLPDPEHAADMLADLALVCTRVLAEVKRRLESSPGNKIFAFDKRDITRNMEVLLDKHYNKALNLAEYHCQDSVVGSSSDKGKLIEICLRYKNKTDKFNLQNTTRRVFLHEIAHSADFEYRKDGQSGHGPDFRRLHAYLLGVAEDIDLYSCEEYQKSKGSFCSLNLNERYCSFDTEKLAIEEDMNAPIVIDSETMDEERNNTYDEFGNNNEDNTILNRDYN